jgi:Flp pilus assembly protein TadD
LNEPDKAIADFGEYIAREPRDEEGYAYRGRSLMAKGDQAGASTDFRKALSLKPGNWVASLGLQAIQATRAMQQLQQIPRP